MCVMFPVISRLITGLLLISSMLTGLSGCLSYDAWEKSRDTLVGMKFDPEASLVGKERIYFVRGVSSRRSVDYSRIESGGVRYYITYTVPFCRYSILVSPDGIIRSWRRESLDRKSCYVY